MIGFNRWDVWLAYVTFEDCTLKKQRPVVVLSEDTVFVLSLKLTSHSPRYNRFEGEYEILKWQEAGLLKPTVVRCGRVLQVEKSDMIKQLGTLDQADINGLVAILRYMNIVD